MLTPELLEECTRMVVRTQFAATSPVQRRMRVGFATAGQLLDALTERGVLGPSDGSAARTVLYEPDQLNQALDRIRGGKPNDNPH